MLSCRSRWLKEPDADSNELFRMVAEIFILWCKSHVSLLNYTVEASKIKD